MEFTVETRCTLEEYRRYNRTVQAVLQKRKQKTIAYLAVLAAAAVLLVWARLTWLLILLAALILVVLPLLVLKSAREVRTAWENNPALRDVTSRFQFGPAEVLVTSDAGEEHRISSSKLYRLIETKTNFYLMVSPDAGFLLDKSACTEAQQTYIRQKCGGETKKK